MFLRVFSTFMVILQIHSLFSVNQEPWLGTTLELDWENKIIYDNYRSVSSGRHSLKDPSSNTFYNTSLSSSLFDYALELDLTGAWTKRQSGNVDQFGFTLKDNFMDDLLGDWLSVTGGINLRQAFRSSLRDEGSFHHGLEEMELFLSFGKEKSFGSQWISRWWGVCGFGLAEKGSPWLKIQGNWQFVVYRSHTLKFLVEAMAGFGKKSLRQHFRGYGPIAHRSFDVGINYTFFSNIYGVFSLEYRYRAYARNFPLRAQLTSIKYIYPFDF